MNSEIIISRGIKIDKDYTNVINYSQTDMVSLCRSNQVASLATFSFIRDKGTIKADFNYSQALTCNYMAFQNPDYSNKWFFAWIDTIEYKGENCIEIRYTIDMWSTWWTAINFVPVLVEREHVNDDTFGLHLLPEPIQANIMNSTTITTELFTDYYLMLYQASLTGSSGVEIDVINGKYYDTCVSLAYNTNSASIDSAKTTLQDALNEGILIALGLFPVKYSGVNWNSGLNIGSVESVATELKSIPAPVDINGYIPVNNKLFTYPFNYLVVDDGKAKILLRYEHFNDINNITFSIRGFANPVGEVECVPRNYEGRSANNYYALSIRDFPMLPTKTDSYQAWLAQKSNATILQSLTGLATGAVGGFMAGGVYGAVIGGAVGSIGSYMAQEQSAKDAPDSVSGGNSASIIDCAVGDKGYYFRQVALDNEQAQTVDNFFSKYGYTCNKIKLPNITGRTHWNYVKINGVCGSGNLPESARNEINRIMNQGTTIWHNHANVGNYFVGGTKMQNPIV